MLGRLWLLVSLSWMGFWIWFFNDSGELFQRDINVWAIIFAPHLVRVAVLFILFGIPRTAPHVINSRFNARQRFPR
jgi:hypothetical protein